jgi:CRISPR/Cas system-associated exonuclease Cas4 (RecB family)
MFRESRPHWSYSALSQFLKCPLQFYFERIAKLPRKSTSDAQVLGSALHSALAEYHRNLQIGQQVQTGQIHEAYHASWTEQLSRNQVCASTEKSLDDSRDLGLALVDLYLKEPPPQNIVAVERPLLAPIANSQGEYLEKPILIIADLVTQQDDGTLQIGELKTSGRAYSESEVATSLQPTFYANALYELTGDEPSVEYTVLIKTKSPKVQKLQAIRNRSDFQRLGDLIGAVEMAVQTGVFYPNEAPMTCSGCSYFRQCREWSGNQVPNEISRVQTKELILC